jgi:hypothetical protein
MNPTMLSFCTLHAIAQCQANWNDQLIISSFRLAENTINSVAVSSLVLLVPKIVKCKWLWAPDFSYYEVSNHPSLESCF